MGRRDLAQESTWITVQAARSAFESLLDPEHHTADISLQRAKSPDVSVAIYLLSKIKVLFEFEGQALSRACNNRDLTSSPDATMVEQAHAREQAANLWIDVRSWR